MAERRQRNTTQRPQDEPTEVERQTVRVEPAHTTQILIEPQKNTGSSLFYWAVVAGLLGCALTVRALMCRKLADA